ncbi:MAG: hypothetical protein P9M14_18670 [Candidatus Alcyoniella australis]|nr:hypothetical protein [Candidatus Alcyoniella australis]
MRHRLIAVLSLVLMMLMLGAPIGAAQSADMPKLPDSALMIPWSDFQQILDRLLQLKQQTPLPDPPLDALVSSAIYRAAASGDSVLIEAELELVVLKPVGWAEVPLLPTGLAVDSVLLDGRPGNFSVRDGRLSLIIDSPGPHRALARFSVPLSTAGGPSGFSFAILPTPATRLEVELPGADYTVRVEPGGVARVVRRDGRSLALTALPPSNSVSVRFQRLVADDGERQARVSATVETMAAVGEGLLSYRTQVNYEILHSPLSSFKVKLPAGLSVIDVIGEGVRDWNVSKLDDGTLVDVRTTFEVVGGYSLTVLSERQVGDAGAGDKLVLGAPEALEISRMVGYLAVTARTNIGVMVDNVEGMQPIDPSELPDGLRMLYGAPVLEGFKYLRGGGKAEVSTVRHRDQAVLTALVENAEARIMLVEEGHLVGLLKLTIRNKRRQYLKLSMPQDAELWATYLDGGPVKPAVDAKGDILIPIPRSDGATDQGQTFSVELIWRQELTKLGVLGTRELLLPAPDLYVNQISVELYLPPGRRYMRFEGNLGSESRRGMTWDVDLDKSRINADQSGRGFDMKSISQSNVYDDYFLIESRGGLSTGALPVQVQIPWQGQRFGFTRSIMDEGEQGLVEFNFVNRKLASWARLIGLLALFFALLSIGFTLIGRSGLMPPLKRRPSVSAWLAALLIYSVQVVLRGFIMADLVCIVVLTLLTLLVSILVTRLGAELRKRAKTVRQAVPMPPAVPPIQTPPPIAGAPYRTTPEKSSDDQEQDS